MQTYSTYILAFVILIGIWQFCADTTTNVRLFVSSPAHITEYVLTHYESLFMAASITFVEAVCGLLLAICVSFILMGICFYFPSCMNSCMHFVTILQVTPLIILAPFFIILCGIGLTSKVLMAAVISFPPIFINFTQGYARIPQNVHDLMDIYNAKLSFRIKKVYLPLALPSIMAGIKISSSLAVIGAIVSEFSGAQTGIGKNLFVSSIRLDPDMMMASLLFSTSVGLIMYYIVTLTERYFGAWYLHK